MVILEGLIGVLFILVMCMFTVVCLVAGGISMLLATVVEGLDTLHVKVKKQFHKNEEIDMTVEVSTDG